MARAQRILLRADWRRVPDLRAFEMNKAFTKETDPPEDEDGEDFAELARTNSKDLGSANQGGDLGFLEKGTSEPAFEDKLFAMKAGEISEPVLTSKKIFPNLFSKTRSEQLSLGHEFLERVLEHKGLL